jgi:predicted nucleic acid-binding protein
MNILALYLRRRQFDLVAAVDLFRGAERLLDENEYEVDCSLVLRLTESSTCSAYDCQFVALAMELKVPLVTADREVLREFPGVAQTPEKFLSG